MERLRRTPTWPLFFCSGSSFECAYSGAKLYDGSMSGRPTRFEHNQFLGDKRVQIVYDLDDPATPAQFIKELVASEQYATFGPDSLAEARNRNYKLYRPR